MRVRLGDVLRLRKEIVHPRDRPHGRATFVGLEHLESGSGRRSGSLEIDLASLTGRKPRFYTGDIVYGYLDLSNVNEIEASEVEIKKLRLHRGDLLLTEGGDPDKLGRGSLWREELLECVHQNHIFRVRFDPAQFVPDFASAQIGSHYGKRYFLAHAKQTTGIATINRKVLAAFPLMTPDRVEQERIAGALIAQMVIAQQLTQALSERVKEIESLREVLLRRAFSGEA